MRRLLCATLIVAAGACVDPSSRIAGELRGYGLPERQANCIGERLESRLSVAQLRELSRAAGALSRDDPTPGRLTAADLIRAAAKFRDTRVPIEAAAAAAACA